MTSFPEHSYDIDMHARPLNSFSIAPSHRCVWLGNAHGEQRDAAMAGGTIIVLAAATIPENTTMAKQLPTTLAVPITEH